MTVCHNAVAARLLHFLKHLDVMVLYVEHHEKLPSTVQFRNSNTGNYVYNVLWIRLGRKLSHKGSQEKRKIEKFFFEKHTLPLSLFFGWEKVSLPNFSIGTSLFRSWDTCSMGACLATISVADHNVRFEVLVALGAKIMSFLDVLLLGLVAHDEGFRGTCSIHLPFSKMVCTK
jgi:hypothetical protein